jgi:hypothetical protein
MKKIVRLTETDIQRIVEKVLSEQSARMGLYKKPTVPELQACLNMVKFESPDWPGKMITLPLPQACKQDTISSGCLTDLKNGLRKTEYYDKGLKRKDCMTKAYGYKLY